MSRTTPLSLPGALREDALAGLVVFLVALPSCLGVASASNAPLSAGILSSILGGILVGAISRSHSSISGPATGLTAVAAAQIAGLGSFEAFLLALVFAGVLQIALGLIRFGFIAEYLPSSVIKGLLAAIGVILILKQIPHIVGHDAVPEGEMAFRQLDNQNTFSEFAAMLNDAHLGTSLIGLTAVVVLVFWERIAVLKKSGFPAALAVVLLGVSLSGVFRTLGGIWSLPAGAFVQLPAVVSVSESLRWLHHPDFSQWLNPAVYTAAVIMAASASLETLLNLEAVDKLDPRQRTSPPSRELLAQGVGNLVAGLAGGIPITTEIVRSSVNLQAGGRTRLAAMVNGFLLLGGALCLPQWLNQIPLSCLAGILLATGIKLASPALFKQMWDQGRAQFLPFIATIVAIVLTDLLIGVLLGLAVSLAFILHSNLRRPLRCVKERHLVGDLVRIELANQVSFLNRAALKHRLDEFSQGEKLLFDARQTDYLDPDVMDLIQDFTAQTAPARGVDVSLIGFEGRFGLADSKLDLDTSNRDLQRKLTPWQVLRIMKNGNQRFRSGERLHRDLGQEVKSTAQGQFPLAVTLSCIDSRSPAELVFDLGVGDIFNVRIAGHVAREKVLASLEYACAVAGSKLIVVLGHTRCGAITAAVDLFYKKQSAREATGCQHLDTLVAEIQKSIDPNLAPEDFQQRAAFVDEVARRNVLRTMSLITQRSETLKRLVYDEQIAVVGGMYDVVSGRVDFLNDMTAGETELDLQLVV